MSGRLIQKLTKRSVAELWDLKLGEKKRNTKPLCGADDPGLLICKTNALRHAAREKNATMVAFGGRAKNKP